MAPDDPAAMGAHQFVALTTFRRDGSPVTTPMWVARDATALVLTTPSDTAKVARVRRDPRVELRPCTRMGRVADGAPTLSGVAAVATPGEVGPAQAALRGKYGWQYRLVLGLERLLARRSRDRVILRVTERGPADRPA